MEACALKTLQILEREYRESEFLKLSRLIMVWVGMPVILFWSIMDYQEWGFQPLWMAIRGTFPIVTVGLAKLAQLKSLRGPYRHQIPFVLYTAYILLFCSLFISQSGYSHSRYFVVDVIPAVWRGGISLNLHRLFHLSGTSCFEAIK